MTENTIEDLNVPFNWKAVGCYTEFLRERQSLRNADQDWTQLGCARKIGIGRATIARIASGYGHSPRFTIMAAYVTLIKGSLDDVWQLMQDLTATEEDAKQLARDREARNRANEILTEYGEDHVMEILRSTDGSWIVDNLMSNPKLRGYVRRSISNFLDMAEA